jgi:Arc/MetJ family transcription regulator
MDPLKNACNDQRSGNSHQGQRHHLYLSPRLVAGATAAYSLSKAPVNIDTLPCVELCLDVPTNLKLDDKLIEATVKLGNFKSKQEAVNTALAEYVQRRQRLRILDLAGKIGFDPKWDYKKLRRSRS